MSIKCDDCNGTGKQNSEPCANCGGRGLVPHYFCGSADCDDPECGEHGSKWKEWRSQQ